MKYALISKTNKIYMVLNEPPNSSCAGCPTKPYEEITEEEAEIFWTIKDSYYYLNGEFLNQSDYEAKNGIVNEPEEEPEPEEELEEEIEEFYEESEED